MTSPALKMGDVGDVGDACFEINACRKDTLTSYPIGNPPYRLNVESGVTRVTRVTSLMDRMRTRRRPEPASESAPEPSQLAAPSPVACAHKTKLVAELQQPPIPATTFSPLAASPAAAEVARFSAVAVKHVFEDGTTGWIDPAYLKTMGRYYAD